MVRFAGVGVASTVVYLVVFVSLRTMCGAQLANLLALLISALTNTAWNRRLTFRIAGRTGLRAHLQGLAVFALGAALTSGALYALHALVHKPALLLEVAVLLAATAVATLVRFVLFSRWVFRSSTA
jgi:putative flippase GtrA